MSHSKLSRPPRVEGKLLVLSVVLYMCLVIHAEEVLAFVPGRTNRGVKSPTCQESKRVPALLHRKALAAGPSLTWEEKWEDPRLSWALEDAVREASLQLYDGQIFVDWEYAWTVSKGLKKFKPAELELRWRDILRERNLPPCAFLPILDKWERTEEGGWQGYVDSRACGGAWGADGAGAGPAIATLPRADRRRRTDGGSEVLEYYARGQAYLLGAAKNLWAEADRYLPGESANGEPMRPAEPPLPPPFYYADNPSEVVYPEIPPVAKTILSAIPQVTVLAILAQICGVLLIPDFTENVIKKEMHQAAPPPGEFFYQKQWYDGNGVFKVEGIPERQAQNNIKIYERLKKDGKLNTEWIGAAKKPESSNNKKSGGIVASSSNQAAATKEGQLTKEDLWDGN